MKQEEPDFKVTLDQLVTDDNVARVLREMTKVVGLAIQSRQPVVMTKTIDLKILLIAASLYLDG